jgi:C-methyltransferase
MNEYIARLKTYIYGNWQTCITYAFAELGIADLLHRSPKTGEELAQETGTDNRALERFLRCAAALALIKHDGASTMYDLTPLGELLRSDHPSSHRAEARLNGAPFRYQPWGQLVDILKAGHSKGMSSTYERGSLDDLADRPEWHDVFHRAMMDLSAMEDAPIASSYDFARFRHVIDIGSGKGSFVKAVLNANPHLQGTMFDLEQTLDAHVASDDDPFDGRLHRQAGDFFEAIPAHADVYMLKNILHNWPEDRARQILRNVRTAMASTADTPVRPEDKRLLIITHLIPEGDDHHIAKWLDVNLMILVDGAIRTLEEYRTLASQAGLIVTRTLPIPLQRYIIELGLAASAPPK